jgi:hypothetical protein
VGYTVGSGGKYLSVGAFNIRVFSIACGCVMSLACCRFRIAIRDICRGLYSRLRGVISPVGGVLYKGVFHSMQSRDVIGVMSIRTAIRDICRGLYVGLRGAISPGGMFILRAFSMVCGLVMSLA